ncbi:MAG: hypothetical protein JWP89_3050 [Schlesneria sp.]|nr:hypothetical protein [Schlesneria sp.]
MVAVTTEYVDNLPMIYHDVLKAFWMFNPLRRANYGVAFQSLYSALSDKHTLGQIREACVAMEQAGVLEIRDGIFAYPTQIGDELIALVNRDQQTELPPFPPLPTK